MTNLALIPIEQLADRHLRQPRSRNAFHTMVTGGKVRIVIGAEEGKTREGQICACLAANLIARQFVLVGEILVQAPEAPMHAGVGLVGETMTLRSRLLEIITLVGAGHVAALEDAAGADNSVQVEVLVGPSSRSTGPAGLRVAVHGADWKVFLGPPEAMVGQHAGTTNPAGPCFAACLAAGEVFRELGGLRDPEVSWETSPFFLSLWDWSRSSSWQSLPNGDWWPSEPLKPGYLVGAGAVGQAYAACFAMSNLPKTTLTIVDDDGLDGTNLNRYVLSTSANAGDPKAPFLAEFLRKAGHGALGFEGKWEDYLNRLPLPAQEPSLAALEEDFKFEIILSCVDKNVARHSLQCSYPRIILGASTLDFRAQVVTHDMGASTACLKCHNPVEAAPIAVDALANQLRQATPAEISLLAKTHGIAIDEINAFIAQDVKCGMLSPEALTRLNGAESHEMSVGFTSVAAGIFLFREMILTSHGKAAHKDGRIGFSFGFDPLYGEEWRLAKNPKCDCSNDGLGAKAYRSRWSHGNGPLKALN